MTEVKNIHTDILSHFTLKHRTPVTPETDVDKAFTILGKTNESTIYAGSFSGKSAWERHPNGDEFIQVLNGQTTITIVKAVEQYQFKMESGSVTIVPRGCWHQFNSKNGVTLLTATPEPTEHFNGQIPPEL